MPAQSGEQAAQVSDLSAVGHIVPHQLSQAVATLWSCFCASGGKVTGRSRSSAVREVMYSLADDFTPRRAGLHLTGRSYPLR